MSDIRIRPQRSGDDASIAALHVRAFGERSTEAVIVALLRQRRVFDPELSLVAELNGRIAGHVLFSPSTIRLLDRDVRAVNLAPIGVDPPLQGSGIGARLIAAGHAAARARGYALSFLLGHASYYPRFGYRTYAYGSSSLAVPVPQTETAQLEARPPVEADVPALHELWRNEEAAVDMSIVPGPDLLDWLSPNPEVETRVWVRDDAVVGYTRAHRAAPAQPHMFLARDHQAARALACALGARAGPARQLVLPLHPRSASAAAFGRPAAEAWEAAMICALGPSPFDEYYRDVRAGTRAPGRPIWPAAFDLAYAGSADGE